MTLVAPSLLPRLDLLPCCSKPACVASDRLDADRLARNGSTHSWKVEGEVVGSGATISTVFPAPGQYKVSYRLDSPTRSSCDSVDQITYRWSFICCHLSCFPYHTPQNKVNRIHRLEIHPPTMHLTSSMFIPSLVKRQESESQDNRRGESTGQRISEDEILARLGHSCPKTKPSLGPKHSSLPDEARGELGRSRSISRRFFLCPPSKERRLRPSKQSNVVQHLAFISDETKTNIRMLQLLL